MFRRILLGAVLALSPIASGRAAASCGSECSCPAVNPEAHLDARLLFDVAHLYIDQNQPRVGAEDATVGAIPGHHDEVRTVNRVTNVRATYRRDAWAFAATLPYVHRTHEHIHHHAGEDHYERWRDDGLGDLEVTAARVFGTSGTRRVRAGLGVKAPTGKQTPALSEGGDELEPSARLGAGAWSLLASLGAEWRVRAPGRSAGDPMPLRAGFAGQLNGHGVENYRHGAEAQVHVGADYPVARHWAILLQGNYRVRGKNDVGDAGDEEEANTGGAALYATPGLRYDGLRGFSIYGLAQFPLWERVNGIQVVAESNLLLGISRSVF